MIVTIANTTLQLTKLFPITSGVIQSRFDGWCTLKLFFQPPVGNIAQLTSPQARSGRGRRVENAHASTRTVKLKTSVMAVQGGWLT